MPKDMIRYDVLAQEAFRGLVKKVLTEVAHAGLPGEHHFYITFKTGAPGVDIPTHLKERFPDEMTIVLQNKFWDLTVEPELFSVGLSFNQIPTKLVVPYSAITAFVDPAVDFGLQFQAVLPEDETSEYDDEQSEAPIVGPDDGSNVVTVDFGRKK